jgi:hypothetical protein
MVSRKYKSRSQHKKSRKWRQKGCQSGGGSMTGGWAWGPSDVHANTGGGMSASASGVPMSINGNHYALNTSGGMAPPQSSNHLVEKGMFGGRRRKSSSRGRVRSSRGRGRGRGRSRGSRSRSRRHRKFIGEQHGGMAALMPETINSALRAAAESPSSVTSTLQGASTAFRTSDPTQQPIGQPIQLS